MVVLCQREQILSLCILLFIIAKMYPERFKKISLGIGPTYMNVFLFLDDTAVYDFLKFYGLNG